MKPAAEDTIKYRAFRFWSVVLGRDAERISVFDRQGGEHFAVVPMDRSGRHNRWTRQHALEQIADHIAAGFNPGEVKVDLTQEGVAA